MYLGFFTKDESVINYKGVRRTAPALLSLFKMGYIYTKRTFAVLTKNAPKWQRSAAGTWQFMSYAMFLHYKAPLY